MKDAHIGITAATGQLADNHDVLSLTTYIDAAHHEQAERALAAQSEANEHFARGSELGAASEQRVARIEGALDSLLRQLEDLDHTIEHGVVAVEDFIRETASKTRQREELNDRRIDEITNAVSGKVAGSLESRLEHLERTLDTNLGQRVDAVEAVVGERLAGALDGVTKGYGASWQRPFYFLVLVDLVALVFVGAWVSKFRKAALL